MSSTKQEVTEILNFPCKMLCLLFVENNEQEGETWFLDILTDISKKYFIINLTRALALLKDEMDGDYYVSRKTIKFKNRDYYNGFVAAKKMNSVKLSNPCSYKKIYQFIQVAPNEILPIQKLLNECENKSIESCKQIVELVRNEDVFYKKFTNV
jgi:hypothetical protein